MVRYDDHARFQMERRGIDEAGIEETLNAPDLIELGGRRMSHLKCLAGRRVMLRVVTPSNDRTFVITAFFDRKKPCV